MAEEIGLAVRVRARGESGSMNRVARDMGDKVAKEVDSGVKKGTESGFATPAPVKGYLSDLDDAMKRNKDIMRMQDLQRKYGTTDINAIAAGETAPKEEKPSGFLSSIFGGGGKGFMGGMFGGGGGGAAAGGAMGAAGAMLGPLAALTIVGQGIFDGIQKVVGILAQASPALQSSLKLLQRSLLMAIRPIGDLLASVLRPLARMMLAANRQARQYAMQYGRPGSVGYTAAYTASFAVYLLMGIRDALREALYQVLDWLGLGSLIPVLRRAFDWLDSTGFALFEGLADTLADIWELFDDLLRPVLEKLRDLINDYVADASETAKKSTFQGVMPNPILSVLGFADGGYMPYSGSSGSIVRVAEKEGEWMVPDSKKRAFAQSVLGSSAGSGGGGSVSVSLDLRNAVVGVSNLQSLITKTVNDAVKESRRA